jgi:hypothetical protein
MGLIFTVILLFIGVTGLRKGRIAISSSRAIEGSICRALSIFYLVAALFPPAVLLLFPHLMYLMSVGVLVVVTTVTIAAIAQSLLKK